MTAISAGTWTVIRGDEGTTPVSNISNFSIQQAVTAGEFATFTGTVLNVMTYGATGDGSTDDTTAIQNALNAVSATVGGSVYFPPGNYLSTGNLVPVSNTRIYGCGRTSSYGSQLTLKSTATHAYFEISNVTGLQIDSLDFVAQATNTTAVAIGAASGGCSYLRIYNNWFAGFYRAFNHDTANYSYQIWIEDNYIDGTQAIANAAGITMRSIQSPTITNNFIQGTSTSDQNSAAILTPTGGGSCQYGVISNNNLGQIGYGINISATGLSDTTVSGNQVTGCGNGGVYIQNMIGCVVTDNTCGDVSTASHGTYHGYSLITGGGTSVITDNIYENEFSGVATVDYGFDLGGTAPVTYRSNRVGPTSAVTGTLKFESGATPFVTPAAITVTGSPFAYTNNDGDSQVVYIVGGTVSAAVFARNATNVTLPGSTGQHVLLAPGDKVTVTYSSAPTMTKVMI